jgi:FkbM family methyltransferase
MDQMPLFHRFPFWYAWNGFRGSQIVWAFFEFFKKLPSKNEVQLPNTFPIIVDETDWISKTIYHGTYERSLLRFLCTLTLSDLIVDVGANIGVTTWHGLRNSLPTTNYVAFEPSSQCLPGLRLSISKLKQEGKFLDYAIGNSDGIQMIYGTENQRHSGGASLIPHSGLRGKSQEVEVRKLDTLLAQNSISLPVSLLKIDTEGYESLVIDGATQVLGSQLVEMIVMEVSPNFGEVSYLKFLDELLGVGYYWFILEEKGSLRREPSLRLVSLDESLRISEQWNLITVRMDVFQKYVRNGHSVFTKSMSKK